jgi:hypothetical protein
MSAKPEPDSADLRQPDRPDLPRRTPAPFDDLFVTEWTMLPAGFQCEPAREPAHPVPSDPSPTAYLGVE